MPFTPQQLAAEHARAMRVVRAVLEACDARRATAAAARDHGMTAADGRWVLAMGKAAIGMAEGLADACGLPDRHLIVTVEGPQSDRLTNILRSDHPLPTQRSLVAGQAVKRFIEEAKAAHAPSITALVSGGASSLICEPIPGIDLDEYRAVVQAMLAFGWDIQQMNTVRRAIDELKGGGLAAFAAPIPIDLLVISDVIGDTLHDIGSGPFVWSPTSPDRAAELLNTGPAIASLQSVLTALSCRPGQHGLEAPRRAVIAIANADAVAAAADALEHEGFDTVSRRADVCQDAEAVSWSAIAAVGLLQSGEALVWGGEWPFENATDDSAGGRCQAVALMVDARSSRTCLLSFATDGVDGRAAPGCPAAAGAFLYDGMTWPNVSQAGEPHESYRRALWADPADPEFAAYRWRIGNSYYVLAHRDAHRPVGEPPAHILTGPTGTNVNDLLIVWRSV